MYNRVGLGTFPLSGVFDPISLKQAELIVKSFIENGGYYFDVAPLYGTGEIERLLGRTLKGIPRDQYYIGTKTIKHVGKDGKLFKSGKYQDVIDQLDNSLLRLNTDYVDLLMIHQPVDDTPVEETLSALEKLQKDGKVKELAVSNVDLNELKEYNKSGKIKYVQNRFSLISRSLSPEFQKYLISNKIFLLPYHLLEIGLLTGIAFESYQLRKDDLREQLPYWNTENQEVIFNWVRESLSPIAKKVGCTIGQLNIAWALHQPFIDYVVVGTTREDYLKINLKANNIELPQEIMIEIESKYQELEKHIKTRYNKTMREFRGLNEKFY